jgi:putative Mn2+ efflux pump MntP
MFEALRAANVDWNVVAGAVATFIVTAIVTAFGFRRGFKRANQTSVTPTSIVGASLMDNMSILMLTEALKENTEIHRACYGCMIKIETLLTLSLNKRD